MNPREKARKLVALAVDERTPEQERATAAVQAIALIHKHSLLDSPLDMVGDALRNESETVKAVSKIYETFTDPTLVGAIKEVGRRFKKGAGETRERRRRRR